jgi:hypothetical protein
MVGYKIGLTCGHTGGVHHRTRIRRQVLRCCSTFGRTPHARAAENADARVAAGVEYVSDGSGRRD